MQLLRAHGLGNDYLVLESGESIDPVLVRALCDRHRGPGGDGVLEPVGTDQADFGVRIWNPDGSIAEKSGNGLRIFARWLHDRGAPRTFTVSTGPCVVGCEIVDARDVSVQMGTASLEVSATGARRRLVDDVVNLGEEDVRVTAISVGNPHCVVFVEDEPESLPWKRWGRALERHPLFPGRSNVQVARVSAGVISLVIWERGAGPTLASGSSATAVAAAAVATRRLPPGRVEARMPGGTLTVDVDADLGCTLLGPVDVIGRFELDRRWLDMVSDDPRPLRG